MLAKVAAILRPMRPDLPRAGDDDTAAAGVEKFDGLVEIFAEARDEGGDGFGFDAQDAFGGGEGGRLFVLRAWSLRGGVPFAGERGEVLNFFKERAEFIQMQSVGAVG